MICNQSHILALSSDRKGYLYESSEAYSSQRTLSILLYKFLTASHKRLARFDFPVKWFPTNLWKAIITPKNRLLGFHYCCSEFNTFKTVFCNYVSSPFSELIQEMFFNLCTTRNCNRIVKLLKDYTSIELGDSNISQTSRIMRVLIICYLLASRTCKNNCARG